MLSNFSRRFLLLSVFISFYSFLFSQENFVDFSTIQKSGTVLIYAHSDDDLIWMLPFWKITEKFIGGAMPKTPSFQTIINQQQTFINNNGYNINYASNWLTPWGSISQQEYEEYYWRLNPDYQYIAIDYLRATWWNLNPVDHRHEVNRIKAKIEQYFADPAVSRIVTHNNWGEYGHIHHNALNLAARELAVKYRKDVWMLGCTVNSSGTFSDVDVPAGIVYTLAPFNQPDLYRGIRQVYINNGCWTWHGGDVVPSGNHKFIKIVDRGVDKSNILTGTSVTVSGPYQEEPGSYIFDGEDDYLTIDGNNYPSFTIVMRVRPDRIAAMDISRMAEHPSSSTADRNFYMNSAGRVSARIYDGSSRVVTSNSTLEPGRWSHIAMTGNGTSLKIYINGMLENTLNTGTAITGYSTPEFILGQRSITGSFFDGQISGVRLYNYAMSDSEIASLGGTVFKIAASAGTNGSINPSGEVTVVPGSSRTFTFTPATGYKVSDIKVDDVSVGQASSYTFSNINANHSISVTFTPALTFTITSNAGGGGTISPSGSLARYEGTDQTFDISANEGFRIADVRIDNISMGSISSYTFRDIRANHAIAATFTAIPAFTISASSGAGGIISPSGSVTVYEGNNRSFTFTPATGFQVSRILVDGNSVGAVTSYNFSNVTANHTISAEFAVATYSVTGTAGTGGSIDPSGTISVNHGSNHIFNISSDNGYHISDVRVDNQSVGAVSAYTFSNITSGHTISASFSLNTYAIESSAGEGGSINPAGEVIAEHGTDRVFTFTPAAGYEISDVLIDNISQGPLASFTFNDITTRHSITVVFSLKKYIITANSGIGGSVSPMGEIAVEHGSNSTFGIIPDPGYQISDVRADDNSLGPVPEYTFNNVTGGHSIEAVFTPNVYIINTSSGAGGSVAPAGQVSVEHGTDEIFRMIPDEGFKVAEVKVNNISVGAVTEYLIDNITAGHNISVTFVPLEQYTINASSRMGGIISPSGQITLYEGKDQTYTIIPNEGFRIENVIIDNIPVGAVSEYTFVNLSADHTISVMFSSDIEVTVFPNPFVEEFNLKIESPMEDKFDMIISDMTGKIVYTSRGIPANTTTPVRFISKPGMYIITLRSNTLRLSISEVIKHF